MRHAIYSTFTACLQVDLTYVGNKYSVFVKYYDIDRGLT